MINTTSPDGYKELLDGVFLKTIVHGDRTLMTEVKLKRGAVVPAHDHPQEQTGYLVSGSLRFFGDDGETVVHPGDSWNFGAGVRHGAEALKDTVVIEVFSPVREDYLPDTLNQVER
ncbi:MAG: cupin domain-containing protein [Acidobacteria bacterium]|uniref:Cupin domain-containing protein n=1 Tax=Candidatus Polarisedimenticola svalbardensis TaxID=2886004 RepID=A0A8J7CML2_9BACT|nr:cupin domain-containing protein [Candidatus Polarisedimenticola svalbardensis]